MSDKSLRVYFTTHHDGRLTGQLLPVWDSLFDEPPPSAYGASEAEVLALLETRVRRLLGEGENALERFLWDVSRFPVVPRADYETPFASSAAEEGEAREVVTTEYAGDETEIGFNASYLQDFLNVMNGGTVSFEFKDGNSQAQLRPASDDGYDYRYVVMPMRL